MYLHLILVNESLKSDPSPCGPFALMKTCNFLGYS